MNKILCLVKEPTKPIKFAQIENDLHALQKAVGGFIEVHALNSHIVAICDEEGRLKNKTYCCTSGGFHFVGTVIWCGFKNDDFTDIDIRPEDYWLIPQSDHYNGKEWTV